MTNGIYPKYLLFALSHPDLRLRREKMYCAHYSLTRKPIERLFGVLFRQFFMHCNKCSRQCVKEMKAVTKSCCILNSVIANARGYEGTMQFRKKLEKHDGIDFNLKEIMSPKCRVEQVRQWREEIQNFKSAKLHVTFTKAPIAYI